MHCDAVLQSLYLFTVRRTLWCNNVIFFSKSLKCVIFSESCILLCRRADTWTCNDSFLLSLFYNCTIYSIHWASLTSQGLAECIYLTSPLLCRSVLVLLFLIYWPIVQCLSISQVHNMYVNTVHLFTAVASTPIQRYSGDKCFVRCISVLLY